MVNLVVRNKTSLGITLKINDQSFKIKYNQVNNLPTFYASLTQNTSTKDTIPTSMVCVTEDTNQNLSQSQKEFLCWHFRLGHLSFKEVPMVLRSGCVGFSPLKKLPQSVSIQNVHLAVLVKLENHRREVP
jgi:hypothetical protein